MTRLRVLLFDVFGTLVDWRSSLIGIAGATGAGEGVQTGWAPVVDDWRRALGAPSSMAAGPGPVIGPPPSRW
jgi:FMN phosphatase YigB (HAD superfamily)